MIYAAEQELLERVREVTGRNISTPPVVREISTDYMSLIPGMVLRLGESDYLLTGEATEGRFGIDDQPKFWVKYAFDLESGWKKIIKLVFQEEFKARVGPFLIRARRNPDKEAAILETVRDHPGFMQGRRVLDRAGNLVRVIDRISGRSLYTRIMALDLDHETYFHEVLPGVLTNLLEAFRALNFLHQEGFQHGDVRTDHLFVESATGRYVWIDFDYEVSHSDYDLWSLGNVLCFLVGKGNHHPNEVVCKPGNYPNPLCGQELTNDDLLLSGQNRVANLAKLFPYIPLDLNRILMRFSAGTEAFYGSVEELVKDLEKVVG